MERLDRILCVIDPTAEEQPALGKARQLALRTDAVLELYVCDYDPALSGRPLFESPRLHELREEFLTERVEYLEELADELRAVGVTAETHVHWDNPVYRGVLRRVAESAPDLVVKDTHHHSAIRRTLLTNTDWNLIRSCPVPLLLAKTGAWPARPTVLAALDPEHVGEPVATLDEEILSATLTVAGKLGAEVHAAHAFLPATLLTVLTGSGPLPAIPGVSVGEIVERERQRISAVLAPVAERFGLPASRIHLEQGSAAEVLPRVARQLAADLVVMGAISRSRLQEIFVGSTAERVLEQLPCDVLVVRPAV
jgi:universal stress protein E